jgi:hypothetical protein
LWMIHEFIHWSKPCLLLLATCDKVLSWIIEVWMKNRLVNGNNCNTIDLVSPKNWQGMTNNVGLAFSVGDSTLYCGLTISIEQGN